MIEQYNIEKLEKAVREEWEKKRKPVKVDKIYEMMDAHRQVEKMRVDNDLDTLNTKAKVHVSVVKFVEYRVDTLEAERKARELRSAGKDGKFPDGQYGRMLDDKGKEAQ